jgi:AcrR family transcriptional regulator
MRKGERKRQLLTAAKALIAAHGFAAATPERLAEEAGVTAALVARYFADRGALIHAVLDALRSETFPTPDVLPPDPAGQLQALLDAYVTAAREPSVGFRVLLRGLVELTDADHRAELTAHLLEWTEPLIRLFQAGQQSGVFRRSLDAQVAAWELVQAVLGYALTGPRDVPADGEPAPPFDALLHGLLKTDV